MYHPHRNIANTQRMFKWQKPLFLWNVLFPFREQTDKLFHLLPPPVNHHSSASNFVKCQWADSRPWAITGIHHWYKGTHTHMYMHPKASTYTHTHPSQPFFWTCVDKWHGLYAGRKKGYFLIDADSVIQLHTVLRKHTYTERACCQSRSRLHIEWASFL